MIKSILSLHFLSLNNNNKYGTVFTNTTLPTVARSVLFTIKFKPTYGKRRSDGVVVAQAKLVALFFYPQTQTQIFFFFFFILKFENSLISSILFSC